MLTESSGADLPLWTMLSEKHTTVVVSMANWNAFVKKTRMLKTMYALVWCYVQRRVEEVTEQSRCAALRYSNIKNDITFFLYIISFIVSAGGI